MALMVRMVTPDETTILAALDPDVFDGPPIPACTAEFLADPRHHLAVALDADVVVGMASAVHYVHPDKPTELWINEVGVSERYHRQGLGRLLIETLLAHGRALGCQSAWVLTEPDNLPAQALYAATGGAAAPCVIFTYDLNSE